eukprot:CAMPEP_0194242192 /NCGR_PEP_ID=MMETSP0158-20130606/7806_1 /TAXON_ID=33649 /ORGANISM="Thalassionema nitzschioides, Strain L26-B" /LENGTH=155 /DNA_ID=CAMNT_0038977231 /DNA_START=30 /DNA_END=497 /DNA_ORIENTATION=+
MTTTTNHRRWCCYSSVFLALVTLLLFGCTVGGATAFVLGFQHNDKTILQESSRPSLALQFSLGNTDFSRIFGKQEAEERRQRDIEIEFRSRHTVQGKEEVISPKDENNKSDYDKNSCSRKNATKTIVGKYVPPPTMGTKTTPKKNISPKLEGNYE